MATQAELLDQELLLNRILDKYGEWMRLGMKAKVRERFDALTPEDRRNFIIKKMNEVVS